MELTLIPINVAGQPGFHEKAQQRLLVLEHRKMLTGTVCSSSIPSAFRGGCSSAERRKYDDVSRSRKSCNTYETYLTWSCEADTGQGWVSEQENVGAMPGFWVACRGRVIGICVISTVDNLNLTDQLVGLRGRSNGGEWNIDYCPIILEPFDIINCYIIFFFFFLLHLKFISIKNLKRTNTTSAANLSAELHNVVFKL